MSSIRRSWLIFSEIIALLCHSALNVAYVVKETHFLMMESLLILTDDRIRIAKEWGQHRARALSLSLSLSLSLAIGLVRPCFMRFLNFNMCQKSSYPAIVYVHRCGA